MKYFNLFLALLMLQFSFETPLFAQSKEEYRAFLKQKLLDPQTPEKVKSDIREFLRQSTIIGNAGDAVERNGELIPADFVLRVNANLPSHYTEPVDFSEFNGLQDELKFALIVARKHGNLSLFDLSDFEIFVDEKMEHHDQVNIPTSNNEPLYPIAYTFTVNSRRIIGIKVSHFKKLTARNQALILIHEMLHHKESFGHDIIHPLISDLNTILSIYDKQRNEKYYELSEEEYFSLLDFTYLAGKYSDTPENGFFSRYGGGEIFISGATLSTDQINLIVQNNYVDIFSTLSISFDQFDPNLYNGNTLIHSNVAVEKSARLADNFFSNAKVYFSGPLTTVQNSHFEQVKYVSIDSGTELCENLRLKNVRSLEIQCTGKDSDLLNINHALSRKEAPIRTPELLLQGNAHILRNSNLLSKIILEREVQIKDSVISPHFLRGKLTIPEKFVIENSVFQLEGDIEWISSKPKKLKNVHLSIMDNAKWFMNGADAEISFPSEIRYIFGKAFGNAARGIGGQLIHPFQRGKRTWILNFNSPQELETRYNDYFSKEQVQ